ncbi:MAG: hypothetical protein Phog2KO_18810 [Phototrophicaceae bacterium]
MKNQELDTLIYQSTKLQQWLFRGIAGFIWFGAILVGLLLLFAPFEPDEEGARLFVAGFGVVFVFTGAYCWHLSRTLPQKALNLIYKHPERIAWVSHVQARKNGIVMHGVHFRTTDNKKVGVNVANGQVAERIVTLVKQDLPHIEVR